MRPFAELSDSGLLWLINRTVFHPRGYALALHVEDGVAQGWELLGDGGEVWAYSEDEDDCYTRAEDTFARARRDNSPAGKIRARLDERLLADLLTHRQDG